MSFNNSSNKTEIAIRVDQRKRHRNFANYFCCTNIFSAKLLICSQTFINLKHILKLQRYCMSAMYVFTQRCRSTISHVYWLYKTRIGRPSYSSTADNLVDLCTDKTDQYLSTDINAYWALMQHRALRTIQAKLKLGILFYFSGGSDRLRRSLRKRVVRIGKP